MPIDDAPAQLLCYLVISQLVAHARTDSWLRTDHLVESARIWCEFNRAGLSWMDRCKLGSTSADLAEKLLDYEALCNESRLATSFAESWRLDYNSLIVNAIQDVCDAWCMPH
ncbi:hypothetical protein Q8F57_027030 [Paraburkholderia terrae]|uniref:hypothetical protein n=1 Tax=Paraburkholderia terrae TaxID=311230 RepID=UPI00296B3FD9|nr:hypothetical protein [Paraburkholderia terrae]MDW3660272.1 hypothetical protein [Paraburkholderia terrae]